MENQKEYIEKYLMGELSGEERRQFEETLKGDPSLQKEVEEYRTMLRGIELGFNRDLKNMLREEENRLREHSAKATGRQRTMRIVFAMAAVIALIIVSVFVLRNNKPDTEEILAMYYKPYPNVETPVTRGEQDRQSGYALYEKGQYKEALKLFDTHLNKFPDDPAALFYSGMCYFELGQTSEAIDFLGKVNRSQNNRYSRPALWYEGLALIKLKKDKDARKIFEQLSKGDDIYSRQSKEILQKIN